MPRRLSHFAQFALLTTLAAGSIPAFSVVPKDTKSKKAPRVGKRQDQKIIQQMEDTWRESLLERNPEKLEPLIADDFLGVAANGTLSDKKQYVDRIRTGAFTFRTMDVDEVKIRMLSDVAIVNSTARIDATLNGAPYKGLYRYTRVYRRNPGGAWKIINFEATRVSGGNATDDMRRGVPIPPPAPAPVR